MVQVFPRLLGLLMLPLPHAVVRKVVPEEVLASDREPIFVFPVLHWGKLNHHWQISFELVAALHLLPHLKAWDGVAGRRGVVLVRLSEAVG